MVMLHFTYIICRLQHSIVSYFIFIVKKKGSCDLEVAIVHTVIDHVSTNSSALL